MVNGMPYHTRVPNRLQGYDYSQNGAYFIRQHRTIPALRLKHCSDGCGTASALPKCSIMSGCGTRIVLRGQKPLALCDRCPCFGSLFPPLAALTFAASSIICAFGLATAAPRSPYRHLELCGIAITFCTQGRVHLFWKEPTRLRQNSQAVEARNARPYGFQHRPTMKELRNQTPPSPHLAVHRFQPPNMADGLPEPEPEQPPTI